MWVGNSAGGAVTAAKLPSHASVVVIGGGVVGLSVAFHLATAGVPDVVLLEQAVLGSGSTSKAAGGVRAQFSDAVNVDLAQRSLRAYERFHIDHGQEIDFRRTGYLFLLERPTDVAAFAASQEIQHKYGVPSEMLDPEDARKLCPVIHTDGLVAAAWSPSDAHCTPESVVLGYARSARRAGARLVQRCRVTGIVVDRRQVIGVETSLGHISTGVVVCAAGVWSGEVADLASVSLPVVPLRRQVLTTIPIPGLDRSTPFTIDFTTGLYFHREGPGLLLGLSDPDETPGFKLSRSDAWLPRLADAIDRRIPSISAVGLASGWAGLFEETPDHNGLVGESKDVSGFLYVTGFSGHGFMLAPALGEVVRDLYLGRSPEVDVGCLDVARFEGSETQPELVVF